MDSKVFTKSTLNSIYVTLSVVEGSQPIKNKKGEGISHVLFSFSKCEKSGKFTFGASQILPKVEIEKVESFLDLFLLHILPNYITRAGHD